MTTAEFIVRRWNASFYEPLVILLSVAAAIVLYFGFLITTYGDKASYNDILNIRILPVRNTTCCSSWPISHFVLFAIMGFLYPQYWLPILAAGVTWEVIEGIINFLHNQGRNHATRSVESSLHVVEYETWWAASNKDIGFNIAGQLLGIGIAMLVRKKIKNTMNVSQI